MNEINITGVLTNDPVMKVFSSGTTKASFGFAWTSGKDGKEKTHNFNCVAWKETAEKIIEKYKAGASVEIHGMITENTWEYNGKTHRRIEIVVFDITGEGEDESAGEDPPEPEDDDIPF